MKDDVPSNLENLLHDALKTGLDAPRGGVPIVQLKTVPLHVQGAPKSSGAPPSSAAPRGLAVKVESVRPRAAPAKTVKAAGKTSPRTSFVALGIMGSFVVAAATGAVWLARERRAAPLAGLAPPPATGNTVTRGTSEGAVGIAIASRPASSRASVTPDGTGVEPSVKSEDSKRAAMTPSQAPTSDVGLPKTERLDKTNSLVNSGHVDPPGGSDRSAKHDTNDKDDKSERGEVAKVDRPEPRQRVGAPPAAARPDPKAASPEKKDAKPAERAEKTASTSPPAGSVDALLQQQLKGAIP